VFRVFDANPAKIGKKRNSGSPCSRSSRIGQDVADHLGSRHRGPVAGPTRAQNLADGW